MWDGKVILVVVVAVIFAALAGRIVAARYRRRVLALMSGGPPPSDATTARGPAAAVTARPAPPACSASLAQNRRARGRLALSFVLISLAIGLSQAWFGLVFVYTGGGFGPIKLLVMGLLYAWVMVPALGLLWRWSWLRSAAWSVAYMAAVGMLVWLRSTGDQQLPVVLGWLASTILPPLLVFALAFSGTARATSPHLLPILLLLVGSSVLGTDILERMMQTPDGAGVVTRLLGFLSPSVVFASFIFAPWLLMAWPAWRSARLLTAGYVAKRFSEPVYLLGGIWLVALLMEALSASHGIGARALWVMASWLWIPLGLWSLRGWLSPPRAGPMLLVLRVFRRDAEVQALFDDVVEAWRHRGPSCLIAGTDLALRTLEPEELFAFVSGRLHERFIGSEAALAQRIRSLDLAADPDGRFRINEFYCFDSTWQQALDGLVAHSDVVLMDLRGLRAENRGSLHELRVLTRASGVRRIVLLFDEHTDRGAAHEVMGAYGARFDWHDARQRSRGARERVLALLLEGSLGPAP